MVESKLAFVLWDGLLEDMLAVMFEEFESVGKDLACIIRTRAVAGGLELDKKRTLYSMKRRQE